MERSPWRPLEVEAVLSIVLSLTLSDIVKLRDRLDAVIRGEEPPPEIGSRINPAK